MSIQQIQTTNSYVAIFAATQGVGMFLATLGLPMAILYWS